MERINCAENKKKRLLPVIIVAMIASLILCLCGCGEVQPPSSVQGDSSVQDDSDVTVDDVVADDETSETEATEAEVTIEETQLYNANGIVVTATKIENSMWGTEISVAVSNESAKNICVTTNDLSVNGYMLSSSGLYAEAAAGKKAYESITLMSSELDEAGIETVAEVEFCLNIYDSETFDDIDNTDLIKLSTSAAENFNQPIDDSGDIIYDANGVRVICKGLRDDVIWDGCVVFYFENNNDGYVSIYSENVSVNDVMVDESLWVDLRANTRSVDAMYLWTLEDVGVTSISDVENIEFNLRIVDEDWDDIAVSDVISLNFNE